MARTLNSQPQSVEAFLNELRVRSNGHLSELEIQELIQETRAHLDASIQARMELGMPRQEAEAEAVQAFGSARAFLTPILEQKRAPANRQAFVLSLAAILLTAVATSTSWSANGVTQVLLSWAAIVCCPILAVIGVRSGRVAWRGVGLACLAAIPIASCLLCISNVAQGWDGMEPRSDLVSRIETADKVIPEEIALHGQFEMLREKAIADLAKPQGPYVVPLLLDTGVFRMKSFATASAARARLDQETFDRDSLSSSLVSFSQWRKDAEDALNRPAPLRALAFFPFAAYISGYVGLFLVLSSGFGAMVRALVRRKLFVRRRRVAI